MSRLKVTNFGPIKALDMDINEYCVFIGPQATGKSTIAKAIYFFLSIKDEMRELMYQIVSSEKIVTLEMALSDLQKRQDRKFRQLFGKVRQEFEIEFSYDSGHSMSIHPIEGYASIHICDSFRIGLEEVFKKIIDFQQRVFDLSSNQEKMDHRLIRNERTQFFLEMQDDFSKLTGDGRSVIYIPACRSFLTTMTNYMYNLLEDDMAVNLNAPLDYASKDFIGRIILLRSHYKDGLNGNIIDREKFNRPSDSLDYDNLEHVKNLIQSILKGEYRYVDEEDRLYYAENDYVKLSFASSGQQEVVWILLLIFSMVLDKRKTLFLIEEPEAHLFPEAQMYLVRLISLFSNLNNNRVILTTHSPYILTSLNNLIYAHQRGKENKSDAEKIIPSFCWVDDQKIGAYYLDKGVASSIIDEELKLIQAERIDETSDILNKQFDDLLQID